jgi:hypothetical protein
MRKLLLLLGVLCCCAATAAMAGPNACGVLWVHDTGLAVSTDPITVWPADPLVADMASLSAGSVTFFASSDSSSDGAVAASASAVLRFTW